MQILVYFFSGERACCRRTINKNVMLSGKGTKIIEMFFVLHGGSIFFAKVVKKVFFTKYIFVFFVLKNVLQHVKGNKRQKSWWNEKKVVSLQAVECEKVE